MDHGLDTEVIAVFTAAVVVWRLASAMLDRLSITPCRHAGVRSHNQR
jgi:hypothetical protein